MVKRVILITFFLQTAFSVALAGQNNLSENIVTSGPVSQEEYIYLVNEYRYDPEGSTGNADIGQSICGTRCNALSADYKNYLNIRGWRLKKVASNNELIVDMNNPFIKGKCTCIADKYLITVQDLYMSK